MKWDETRKGDKPYETILFYFILGGWKQEIKLPGEKCSPSIRRKRTFSAPKTERSDLEKIVQINPVGRTCPQPPCTLWVLFHNDYTLFNLSS